MQYSGILVRSVPGRLQQCAAGVAALDGVDVYVKDDSASCVVAVIESDVTAGHEECLRRIQDLPDVATADLVYHRSSDFDDEGGEARR